MFKKNNEEKKLKKIFQWEQYLSWKKMSQQQKINFKRACLFPLLALMVFNFLREFTYAILLIISFYLLLRFFKRRKISK